MFHKVIYIMGVSGSGKTTIGRLLSERAGFPFFDGDDFHSAANVAKMRSGQPLNDEDRSSWLQAIHELAMSQQQSGSIIIACSALKESYRQQLTAGMQDACIWIFLQGSFELISGYLKMRSGHFMPPALLQSQFDILEIPEQAITIDVSATPENIVQKIFEQLTVMKSAFGLMGLGVMGKSLARNLAGKGVQLSLYNRYLKGVEEKVAEHFICAHPELKMASGFEDIPAFVQSLALPRKILLMLPAGAAIDEMIEMLVPHLDAGDVLIDAGNSHYKDTERRMQLLATQNILYIGSGVSGGEAGALSGPAVMPGGSSEAYQLVRPFLEMMAARDFAGGQCCAYIGKGGAGHFVKMVHNGIEYAEMQLIAELYSILRRGMQQNPDQIASVFEGWLSGKLQSYLLEITVDILRTKEDSGWLIDSILDTAGNKGTGNWTTIAACELGVPIPTISAALFARYQSAFKAERMDASAVYQQTYKALNLPLEHLAAAYQTARLVNHQQGFHLIIAASAQYDWQINISELARIWSNGCIIRSRLMEELVTIFKNSDRLLMHPVVIKSITENLPKLVELCTAAAESGIAVPCFSNSLQYLQQYVQGQSAANLIQAQRDYFGAHTYQRIDDESGKSYHTLWTKSSEA